MRGVGAPEGTEEEKRGSGFVSSNELGLNLDEIGAREGWGGKSSTLEEKKGARGVDAWVLSTPSSGLRIPPKLRVVVGGTGEARGEGSIMELTVQQREGEREMLNYNE